MAVRQEAEDANGEIARLSAALESESSQAAECLLPEVYDELRRLARSRLARFGIQETLTPTELVHETYLRLACAEHNRFEGCRHFFFAASRSMRDLMVESARRKASLKRGGQTCRVLLEDAGIAVERPAENLLDLDAALCKLERANPSRAQVVQLRYFGGFTHPEIAEIMGLSLATVERRWSYARAWLRRELAQPCLVRE